MAAPEGVAILFFWRMWIGMKKWRSVEGNSTLRQ